MYAYIQPLRSVTWSEGLNMFCALGDTDGPLPSMHAASQLMRSAAPAAAAAAV
jgi:hypothetical protein